MVDGGAVGVGPCAGVRVDAQARLPTAALGAAAGQPGAFGTHIPCSAGSNHMTTNMQTRGHG